MDFYGHYYIDKHDLEILCREFVTYMRSEMKSLHVRNYFELPRVETT